MIKQKIWNILIVLVVGSMTSISADEGNLPYTLSANISIQLNNVPGMMSEDIQAVYESAMSGFYLETIYGSHTTATMIAQVSYYVGGPEISHVYTILSLSGFSNLLPLNEAVFRDMVYSVTAGSGSSASIIYLLQTANQTYFGSLTSINVSTPTPARIALYTETVEAPAPAAVIVPSGPALGSNNSIGVKGSIIIETLWFIAVSTLGLCMLFL